MNRRNSPCAELPQATDPKLGWPWSGGIPKFSDLMPDGTPWPRITVVTPSYNQGQYLEEAIRSVLMQGYPNLQYILMDGGSTDASVEVICKYGRWIDYFCVCQDGGQTDALNKGFSMADGDLMSFVNSDDLLAPGSLEQIALSASRAHRTAEDSLLLIARCVRHFGDSKELAGADWIDAAAQNDEYSDFVRWISGEASLQQPGTFWSKALWKLAGPFPLEMHYAFDRYFFAKASAFEPNFTHVPKLLAFFRVHEQSKTAEGMNVFVREWQDNVPRILNEIPGKAVNASRRAVADWYALRFAARALNSEATSPYFALHHMFGALIAHPRVLLARPFWGAIRRILRRGIGFA